MIALVIIALLLVLWLVRGTGGHGPARHMSGGGAVAQPEAPAAATRATSAPGRTA